MQVEEIVILHTYRVDNAVVLFIINRPFIPYDVAWWLIFHFLALQTSL